MRKPSRKTQDKKARAIWGKLVRDRANNLCEYCLKPGNQPHHIVGVKNLTLRFDLRNGCCLCFTHHTGGNDAAHNDPMGFLDWFEKYRKEDFDYLMVKRIEITHQIDYKNLLEGLK